jgi:phospholipid/cholesterol/gamma-HCH transport system permease protein
MFVTLGRWSLIRLSLAADICAMIATALRNVLPALRHPNSATRAVLMKQLYFTGLEASGIIITVAVILGTVVITQVVSLVGTNGALAGKILVWVVMRELAPLLTAIVVIARSGTAIAAELGSMKINGEIDSLEMMGIPAERYLLFPRIVGVTGSLLILVIYFVMASSLTSFAVASLGWHISFEQFSQGVILALGAKEVLLLFVKSLLFGLCISATCCCYGLSVDRSVTEIPQVATKAVMTSLLLVFILDGLLTYLSALTFS